MDDDRTVSEPRREATELDGLFALTPTGSLGLRGPGLRDDEQAEVLDQLFFEDDRRVPYLVRFAVLMIVSTTIAALGMINDSTAVVIGAMLVAPLMTPLLAIAASLVQGWPQRIWESIAIVVGGGILGFSTAVVVSLAGGSPLDTGLTDELLARTHPNLIDLGIAAAAGAAGGYVMLRREASAALPGVGIAVALVPPLAAVGILWQRDETERAADALLLLGTNLATIVLSAAVVFIAAGFVPQAVLKMQWRKVRRGLLAALVLVVLIAVPLALHTREILEAERLQQDITALVPDWDPTVEIVDLTVEDTGDRLAVDLAVVGPAQPPPAWRLAELISDQRTERVDVDVSFRQEIQDSATAI